MVLLTRAKGVDSYRPMPYRIRSATIVKDHRIEPVHEWF